MKRLILILALALVVGIACTAYAEVQNVKVSGDLTVLGIMRELSLVNNNNAVLAAGASGNNDKNQHIIGITRLRVDADLTDNVSATIRFINDRCWGTDDETGANTDIDLDLAYATFKEFLYSPLTLRVGRQELHFGNDMIVGDPWTNNATSAASNIGGEADLSVRKAFDAVRASLNYDPLVIDIITAKIAETTLNRDDDTDLYGVNLNYALDNKTTLEGYWFERHNARKQYTSAVLTASLKPVRVDTIGLRLDTKLTDALRYQLELARQFGRFHQAAGTANDHGVELRAWALETFLDYSMPDKKYSPMLGAMYAYFSGDEDDYNTNRSRHKAWQPMFENQTFGHIVNAIFNQTNMHIVGVKGSMKPADDLTLTGEYYSYWWAKAYRGGDMAASTIANVWAGTNMITTNKSHVGQEIDLKAIYDYTEDVQFCLLTGVYVPGMGLNGSNRDTATEVIGSMKVTF